MRTIFTIQQEYIYMVFAWNIFFFENDLCFYILSSYSSFRLIKLKALHGWIYTFSMFVVLYYTILMCYSPGSYRKQWRALLLCRYYCLFNLIFLCKMNHVGKLWLIIKGRLPYWLCRLASDAFLSSDRRLHLCFLEMCIVHLVTRSVSCKVSHYHRQVTSENPELLLVH